jgi:hypothetical protein
VRDERAIRVALPGGLVALALAGVVSGAAFALSLGEGDTPGADALATPSWAPSLAPVPPPPTPGFSGAAPGFRLDPERLPSPALLQQAFPRLYEFYFTRAVYSDWRGGYSWRVDYPEADWFFSQAVRRLAALDAHEEWGGNPVWLGDPELRRHPFLYALEVGNMYMTEQEVEGLRSYLAHGGFLMIDDFWGTQEWANFEREISRVLPGRAIVDIPLDHTLFKIFYSIDEIWQVPNITNGRAVSRGFGQTHESDGYVPHVRGIFDDDGRLMVVIHWNTDLGDAWEWADDPYYPLRYSTYAFQVAINTVLYAMTH